MSQEFKMRRSLFSRFLSSIFKTVNRYVEWHRLPTPIAIFNLLAFRDELREQNLHNTETSDSQCTESDARREPQVLTIRTLDGMYNDLRHPRMGSANTRFGRNFPLEYTYPEADATLLAPSPRTISNHLLKRDAFVPATTLNLLAAAWIQFQTHDWFNHGTNQVDNQFELPLKEGDPWHENPMRVGRTMLDPTRAPAEANRPPTYVNPASQWWDASGIYGGDESITRQLRTFEGGQLIIEGDRLPIDPEKGVARTGFNENWWVGLMLLHSLFTLEHNAICRELQRAYPAWSDEELFHRARMINAALMAKIHTVEWTPGILQHPALQVGMRANWWGLAGERLYRMFGRLGSSEIISGIPGSPVDHHSAPFALTEEFASVYRLHPLMPDEFTFSSLATGEVLKQLTLPEVAHAQAETVINDDLTMADAFYSFGISHPGAITLHNYPNTLRTLQNPDGTIIDLAAVDILRDRERGVPRYNQFRRLIHRKPVESFDEITDNKQWAAELRDVYNGDVERVDLMVGMFAEPLPKGFGFSDTAFRIFILMASRRLKSDRFFGEFYTPEVYTPEGMRWINDNTMLSVLRRHYPALAPALVGVKNAFAPWSPV